MANKPSARTTAANTSHATASRRSDRFAGRPPTTGTLPSNARFTKKPRKQPSRRNGSNGNRIASAVAENEQGPQPAGERTPPEEELASEQRHQPAGERNPPAEVLDTEQRLQTANESIPPAEVLASEPMLQIGSETGPPAEVSVNEQRLQTANERIPSAEVSANAGIRTPIYYRGLEIMGSLWYESDEELRFPDQQMSDGYDDGGGQRGDHAGREIENVGHGNVQSPPSIYGEGPVRRRYPSPPNRNLNGHGYSGGIRQNDDEDSEQGPGEPENEPAPPYEYRQEAVFLQGLLDGVATQRALRRKMEELRKCQQNAQDAKLVAQSYQTALREIEPTTDGEWSMFRATEANIREWETKVSKKQDFEARINLQVEFLEDRADDEARSSRESSQDNSQLSRERRQLEFLSRDDDFWETFDNYQAACQSLTNIDLDLRQSNAYKNSVNEAIKRSCEQEFNGAADDFTLFSILTEKMIFGDLSRISDALDKHNKLQDSKLAAEKLQAECWMQLLTHAEAAFFRAGVLEKALEA